MELKKFVVADRTTINQLDLDRIMDAIVKAFETEDQPSPLGEIGGTEIMLSKLSMTHYTYDGLDGTQKAIVSDGQRLGMCEVLNFEGDLLSEFEVFNRTAPRSISWEQRAALFWSQRMPGCCLVSESEQVLDAAEGLGVSMMTMEEMQEAFFADVELAAPPLEASPFNPLVDAGKVEAAFSDGLEGDLAVLRQKSYWIVVCVLFEWVGWLRPRKRSAFCSWVNAHFHFDNPINAETDLKSATNKIKAKEHNLALWPDNPYRDLAYVVRDKFFGERQGLSNGYYVYANEPRYLKPDKMWRRRDW